MSIQAKASSLDKVVAMDSVSWLEQPVGWQAERRSTVRPFASVDVSREADATVLAVWAELEAKAPCSIYQTRAWLLPWIATLGRTAQLTPVFLIARDEEGVAVALLCLGLGRRGLIRIATFLGGKDSNLNLALIRPGQVWTKSDICALLSAGARALASDAPDAFVFLNQPKVWNGVANPLARINAQPSPSAARGTQLMREAQELFGAKVSKSSRKKLRKKEMRLAAMDRLTYATAMTSADRTAVLDAFFTQRLDRFRTQNIKTHFDDPSMRRFIEMASEASPYGVGIELHALYLGARIVAVYGGAAHQSHWSGMFNSFDSDPEIARSSPGELLLMAVIGAQCAAGHSRFDLGIGEARYKATFCEETIPLFDSFYAMTLKGAAFVRLRALAARGKRVVKQNRNLFAWAKRLRAALVWPPAA